MLKKQLIETVANQAGETQTRTRKILDALDQVVRDVLAGGDTVMLAGLGRLVVRRRSARKARDMVTGAAVTVAAHNIPALVPSVGLKSAVNPS